jgi:hypothetical protein
MQKVDARSISPSPQEHLPPLAFKAVLDGKKQKEVAQLLGVTPQTICGWVKAYRLQGQEALKSKTARPPERGKLLFWQAAQIAKAVIDHNPEPLELPFTSGSGKRSRCSLSVDLACSCQFGPSAAISNSGALPRKNWRGGPGNKIRSRSGKGWRRSILSFAARHRGKRLKYTGAMKWG